MLLSCPTVNKRLKAIPVLGSAHGTDIFNVYAATRYVIPHIARALAGRVSGSTEAGNGQGVAEGLLGRLRGRRRANSLGDVLPTGSGDMGMRLLSARHNRATSGVISL